jgi:hypothetical protein
MKFEFWPKQSRFRSLLEVAKEERRISQKHAEREVEAVEKGGKAWKIYRKETKEYLTDEVSGIERKFPGTLEEIRTFQHVREQGDESLVVDLFGGTNAASLGADKTIALTLVAPEPSSIDQIYVEGNAYETSAQIRLIDAIDESGAVLTLVICVPGAALSALIKNAVNNKNEKNTYHNMQLIRLFESVFDRMAAGGIFILKLNEYGDVIEHELEKYLKSRKILYKRTPDWPFVFKIYK